VFALSDLLGKPSGQPSFSPAFIDAKEDLAALLIRRGTAGLNKGVMISHFNLVSIPFNRFCTPQRPVEDDVFLSFLPFNHIYGLTYFLCGAIYLGASQVIMARFDARKVCG